MRVSKGDGLADFPTNEPFKTDLFDFVGDLQRSVQVPEIENRKNKYQKTEQNQFERVLRATVPSRMLKEGAFGDSKQAYFKGNLPGRLFKDGEIRVKRQSLLEDNSSLVRPIQMSYRAPTGKTLITSQLNLIRDSNRNARHSASILMDQADPSEQVFDNLGRKKMPTNTPTNTPNNTPQGDDDERPQHTPYDPPNPRRPPKTPDDGGAQDGTGGTGHHDPNEDGEIHGEGDDASRDPVDNENGHDYRHHDGLNHDDGHRHLAGDDDDDDDGDYYFGPSDAQSPQKDGPINNSNDLPQTDNRGPPRPGRPPPYNGEDPYAPDPIGSDHIPSFDHRLYDHPP
jgi:hypothetical protein